MARLRRWGGYFNRLLCDLHAILSLAVKNYYLPIYQAVARRGV